MNNNDRTVYVMPQNYNDIRINTQKSLIHPRTLYNELPVSSRAIQHIIQARDTVRNIIQGSDNRLLIIAGPCSIHDTTAALEYAGLLKEASTRLVDDLVIIMRVYFAKPRTTIGWKGLISDPGLDETFDVNHGLKLARKLLIELCDLKIAGGTEFLDTIIPQYLSDLICWSAIGARTSESQLHRELASGLAMPVGFKNSTDGNIKIAIDAADTARYPHHFPSIDQNGAPAIIHTTGNDCCHIILRGSSHKPNYDAKYIHDAEKILKQTQLAPHLMIDCSHGNSMKNYQNQKMAAENIAQQIEQGSHVICGVMFESNLVAGSQQLIKHRSLTYGQSITDECLSWKETQPLLDSLALAVRKRNQKRKRQ